MQSLCVVSFVNELLSVRLEMYKIQSAKLEYYSFYPYL